MAGKPKRPAPRSKSKGKGGGRSRLGPLLLLGLILFVAGVYFGGRWFQPANVPPPLHGPVTKPVKPPANGSQTKPTKPPSAGQVSPPAEGTPPGAPLPPRATRPARVALVIDDLGRSLEEVQEIAALGVPVTYAVLPFESLTPKVVEDLHRRQVEVLCHLPMEATGSSDPGPGALHQGMSEAQLIALTRSALEAVPGAVGVNNHMGSSLSADRRAMHAILGVVAEKSLFYLDSRTSPKSLAYDEAMAMGLPAAERQVFLDDDPDPAAIEREFRRLLDLAVERGAAIAIGHPHPGTLEMLRREVPRAKAAGYEFVPVSYLVDRRVAAPD